MRFFTGKGDSGYTNLFDGSEVRKDSAILNFIGIIDEVTAYIGFAISNIEQSGIRKDLRLIQKTLSGIMGVIGGGNNSLIDIKKSIKWLEKKIDFYGEELENPKSFTFPGETTPGAILDICRTITRKMERQAISFFHGDPNYEKNLLIYLNRLSSLLYILRRFVDTQVNT